MAVAEWPCRMAVAGGRVICTWLGWPAGRMAVVVAGRPACGRVAGWAGVVGWPAGRMAVAGWPGGCLRGRMAGPCPNCAGPGLNQG